jgi:hypothetical protein
MLELTFAVVNVEIVLITVEKIRPLDLTEYITYPDIDWRKLAVINALVESQNYSISPAPLDSLGSSSRVIILLHGVYIHSNTSAYHGHSLFFQVTPELVRPTLSVRIQALHT